jgi:type IV pilus assembly protein PilB
MLGTSTHSKDAAEVEARLDAIAQLVRAHGTPAPTTAAVEISEAPDWAGARPPVARTGRLGEVLVGSGLVSLDEIEAALKLQQVSGQRLGEILVENGIVTESQLAKALADHRGVAFVDLETTAPDPALLVHVPEEFARRYGALPIRRFDNSILVAMADPTDIFALDDLRVLTGRDVVPAFADSKQLTDAIDRAYHRSEIENSLDDAAVDFGSGTDFDTTDDDFVDGEDAPVIRLVNMLLEQAITDGASDLHIEPTSGDVRIRMRIDGVLHNASEAPPALLRPLISRLKVLGGLDIANHRTPQDGRFSVTIDGNKVDVRVATMPTEAGEAAVLRLLPTRAAVDIAKLGLSDEEHSRLAPAINSPQGAVFVTGPTGSGKTTTLYALLGAIDSNSKAISSVEDPVEYRMDAVKQISINNKAGMTFPAALRSILRADPDVIMVGEVRDAETARIAADASITGHLVLSTLHTTTAAAAPMRLVDMGVEPYLVASAMSCVVAQRLARTLCKCAVPADESVIATLKEHGATDEMLEGANVHMPVGCVECRRTGYKGRTAIFEIMPVDETISRLIVERAPTADIEKVAVEKGMDTMKMAALKRVLEGTVGIDEMLRVVS